MCRSIKPLFHFEPPASDEEVRSAALQFVRKVSGFHEPSKANEDAFTAAVDSIAHETHKLLKSLHTAAPLKDRTVEAAKAHARWQARVSEL